MIYSNFSMILTDKGFVDINTFVQSDGLYSLAYLDFNSRELSYTKDYRIERYSPEKYILSSVEVSLISDSESYFYDSNHLPVKISDNQDGLISVLTSYNCCDDTQECRKVIIDINDNNMEIDYHDLLYLLLLLILFGQKVKTTDNSIKFYSKNESQYQIISKALSKLGISYTAYNKSFPACTFYIKSSYLNNINLKKVSCFYDLDVKNIYSIISDILIDMFKNTDYYEHDNQFYRLYLPDIKQYFSFIQLCLSLSGYSSIATKRGRTYELFFFNREYTKVYDKFISKENKNDDYFYNIATKNCLPCIVYDVRNGVSTITFRQTKAYNN